MSREAQAERERRARVILGTAEMEISAKFSEASQLYKDNPVALHLRAMNMLYEAVKERGSMVIVPIVDSISRYVDQRVRVTSVSAESTLTRDTVPTNVDAIVFWVVWDAEKSILEVQDFYDAITMSAQTALRESIGRHELAQMITERETLGRELQRILDE